ncbi:MAG: M28 family peptidase [Bacteroidales bacterium]
MKRIYLLAFALCMILAINSRQAQKNKIVDKIIEIGQTDNQTMNHLDVLCNRFGGRILGSDAYENAAEWCVAQFKKWGMETELDEAGVLPVGFNRGPWFGRLLSENGMDLHFATPSYTSGGVDDGSGATPTMEAAGLIMAAGGKPKLTILACLWAGEEFGLLGSKSWVEKNIKKWDNISNYFNRDGGPTVANSLNVTEAMYDDFVKICEPLNSINPDFPFTLTKRTDEPRPRPTSAGGSDHAYFAMNGIPTVSFGTADSKGYDFNYGEIWHTERDMYNKSIPEYQNQTSVVTAVVVYGVANLDHVLSRKGLYLEPAK